LDLAAALPGKHFDQNVRAINHGYSFPDD